MIDELEAYVIVNKFYNISCFPIDCYV